MDENRHRHTVWMDDGVWDQVETHYQKDNCSTKNEYIEKAIRFYSGYLDTQNASEYLPRVLADVLEGKLGAFGTRIGRQLFKLTVDQCLMGQELAAGSIRVCWIFTARCRAYGRRTQRNRYSRHRKNCGMCGDWHPTCRSSGIWTSTGLSR